MVRRSLDLVLGKWSDLAAAERRLAELGMSASVKKAQAIFRRTAASGLAWRNPLADTEFLEIPLAEGAAMSQ
jgi:hypothetical protein